MVKLIERFQHFPGLVHPDGVEYMLVGVVDFLHQHRHLKVVVFGEQLRKYLDFRSD